MEAILLEFEGPIRLGAFVLVFSVMGLWEWLAPRRVRLFTRMRRWSSNLGLVAVDIAVVRVVFPAAAVGVAAYTQEAGWGLFNQMTLPYPLVLISSLLLLDLAIYFQHVLSHHIPILWRLHRVHHADADFDVTTALRFHPIEILFSMGYKSVLIILLGAPVAAVILFEVILNASAMFNHGNVSLPSALDRAVRRLLVTPDMHRVHHSVHGSEANRNFGFSLSVWDRLFGTYQQAPALGHDDMVLGLPMKHGHFTSVALGEMLMIPFRRLQETAVNPGNATREN